VDLRICRSLAGAALMALFLLGSTGTAQADFSWSDPFPLNAGEASMSSVACPSMSRCVAVDGAGDVLAFDPAAPAVVERTTLADKTGLGDVACPSPTRCVAVGARGLAVVFDPAA